MDKLIDKVSETYKMNKQRLETDYNKCEKDELFKKVTSSLKMPKKELMKYTTKFEKTIHELKNCQNCKNILECKNEVEGYVYYPDSTNQTITFSYLPCKYKTEMEQRNAYQKNIYMFDIPKEIKEASMKNIITKDKLRIPIIKWLKTFIDTYPENKNQKGLYLQGNFGSGKTYLISAMLNELAKQGVDIAIIYYPEYLRDLKSTFNDEDEFNRKFNYIKRVNLLLIDDIGAENVTAWCRDEILGSILQYRMQDKLPTFFTSNLTIKELEEHLSLTTAGVDKLKARRIIERINQLTDNLSLISENKRE